MPSDPGDESGSLALRPRARLLRILGDELISSEIVALIELVKNSYDADATRVLIRFVGPLNQGTGYIQVIDDGHGMELATIQNSWMEPATNHKKRARWSNKGRRLLGEKGIGRFAASRLADHLTVISRFRESQKEVRVLFDWKQFDVPERYLDEVEVLWEVTPPREVAPTGAINALLTVPDSPDDGTPPALTHGTILRMEGVRIVWNEEQFEKLRSGLSRLVSPFSGSDNQKADNQKADNDKTKLITDFGIYLELPSEFERYTGRVDPPDSLQKPHYLLSGNINPNGLYNFSLHLRNQVETISGVFKLPQDRQPSCGPISLELRVWDRDDLAGIATGGSSTLEDIRSDLDQAAGINIYRDGFRVLPYGEPRNDWLRLDLRRVQNPTLRLSNNQIVGYVLISADGNSLLRDQSNREGIIDSIAFDDLQFLVRSSLNEIETRRYKMRRGGEPPNPTNEPRNRNGLFDSLNLFSIQDFIRERRPNDRELLGIVRSKQSDLERGIAEVKGVIARYQRLATLGQLIDTILHDARAPLAKIKNDSVLLLQSAKREGGITGDALRTMQNRLENMKEQGEILSTVLRKIQPFSGRKRGKPARVVLEGLVAASFSILETEIAEVGATTVLPSTETQATVDSAEFQQIILNLLQNSLHWLREVPKEQRRILVRIERPSTDLVEIVFSDSGPGVRPEYRDRIFEPYFSGKVDGIGLGLAIAGDIIADYYNGELELVQDGPLAGATFRFTLRRRI